MYLKSRREYRNIKHKSGTERDDMLEKTDITKQRQCDITHKRDLQIIKNAENSRNLHKKIRRKLHHPTSKAVDHVIYDKDGQQCHMYEKMI